MSRFLFTTLRAPTFQNTNAFPALVILTCHEPMFLLLTNFTTLLRDNKGAAGHLKSTYHHNTMLILFLFSVLILVNTEASKTNENNVVIDRNIEVKKAKLLEEINWLNAKNERMKYYSMELQSDLVEIR